MVRRKPSDLTSASSKTAMGLASVQTPLAPNTPVRPLPAMCFRGGKRLYDRVLSYDDIGGIEGTDSVVDFAGNANVLRRLREHLGNALKCSYLVGATHVDQRGSGTDEIPGPTPTCSSRPIMRWPCSSRSDRKKRAADRGELAWLSRRRRRQHRDRAQARAGGRARYFRRHARRCYRSRQGDRDRALNRGQISTAILPKWLPLS